MLNTVPAHLLQRIQTFIGNFALLGDEQVAVATSGGKDSVFACLALRDLGYSVVPVLVDMEFTQGWGNKVLDQMRSLNFDNATVLNARSLANTSKNPTTRSGLLKKNLLALDMISSGGPACDITPCTSCYNSKILSIEEHFEHAGFGRIVFAHHATDFVTSFLKSALMYIDRWDDTNKVYDRSRFLGLCQATREKLEVGDDSVLNRLRTLASEGCASTDEPPRQLLRTATGPELVRPLLSVWESEIEEFVNAAELETEPSGCGHSISASTQTPRELVQYELVRPLEGEPVLSELYSLALQNIDPEGRLTVDARRARDNILGTEYKQPFDGIRKF
mgnify:FL=1